MANNVFAGPNILIAKTDISFAAAGIDFTNTLVVFLVGTPLKSFKPGRAINSITGFQLDKGYYLQAITDFDISDFTAPPFGTLPGIDLADEDGLSLETEGGQSIIL
jgi:hypothetical protein